MEEKNISSQSKRLKRFINETGFSYSEFARQCNIPQTRSITAICSDGKVPTAKLLEKIIKRFPQLNYDWVLLGYGEMIVQGMQMQPANANSLKKSRDASYENIHEYLQNHDYTLNSLANKIEKALLSSAKVYQNVNDRLSNFEIRLENLEKNQNDFITWLDNHRAQAVEEVGDELDERFEIMFNKLFELEKRAAKELNNVLNELKKNTNNKVIFSPKK
tara:strand:+ start:820 stop:1473 length:654 start_codon:yes stop_codon:yes gene_type:complete